MLSAVVSALRVLALAIGLPSVWWRGRAGARSLAHGGLHPVARPAAQGEPPDTSRARTFYVLNHAEMGIVVVMVFAASFLARGFGQR